MLSIGHKVGPLINFLKYFPVYAEMLKKFKHMKNINQCRKLTEYFS